jgi:signal transduction histidine kinase
MLPEQIEGSCYYYQGGSEDSGGGERLVYLEARCKVVYVSGICMLLIALSPGTELPISRGGVGVAAYLIGVALAYAYLLYLKALPPLHLRRVPAWSRCGVAPGSPAGTLPAWSLCCSADWPGGGAQDRGLPDTRIDRLPQPVAPDPAEDQLAAVLDALDGYAVIKDLHQRIIRANLAYAKAVGADHPDLLAGMTDAEVAQAFPPGCELCSQAADELAAQLLKHGEAIERDLNAVVGGSPRMLRLRLTPLYDSRSQVHATLSVWRDTTGQNELHGLLLRDEGVMKQAERTGRFGWFSVEFPAGACYWSPGMYAIHGLPAAVQPPAIETLLRMVHADDRQRVEEHLLDAHHGRIPQPTLFRCLTTAGLRYLHHDYYIGRDPGTGGQVILGIVHDVTEFHQTQQALAEANAQLNLGNQELAQSIRELQRRNQELAQANQLAGEMAQRFDLVMHCAHLGVWDWELDRGRLRVNDILLTTLGYEAEEPMEFSRKQWQQLVHPDEWPLVERWPERHPPDAPGLLSVELRLRHADGTWRWFACRGQAVPRMEAKAPRRMLGTLMDIHHERLAESRLRQAQRLAAIGTLAGGIAHDFNNILFAISGNAEMADARVVDDSPAKANISEIIDASMRAKLLVSQLLAFARPERPAGEQVDPARVLSEVLEFTRPLLPRGINLACQVDTGGVRVACSAEDLHEIIWNLCLNATQALETATGTITISLDTVVFGPEETGLEPKLQPGLYLRLRVSDTGVGIAPEQLPRIFDPYFSTRDIGHGRGLGLAVAHGIAAGAGGGITAASKLGQGSEFTVYLPAQPHAAPEPPGQIAGGTERLLFACNDERVALLVEAMLQRLGYAITITATSHEALALLSNPAEHYDMLLAVPALPDFSGTELMQRVRELQPGLALLLLTHFNPVPGVQVLSAQGAYTHLDGPHDLPSLARSIRSILDG